MDLAHGLYLAGEHYMMLLLLKSFHQRKLCYSEIIGMSRVKKYKQVLNCFHYYLKSADAFLKLL